MTFSVFLDRLSSTGSEIRDTANRLNYKMQSLEDVRRELSYLSGMEGAIKILDSCVEEIDQEMKAALQMYGALERVVDLYNNSETRIAAETDGAVIRGAKRRYGVTRDVFEDKDIWTLR